MFFGQCIVEHSFLFTQNEARDALISKYRSDKVDSRAADAFEQWAYGIVVVPWLWGTRTKHGLKVTVPARVNYSGCDYHTVIWRPFPMRKGLAHGTISSVDSKWTCRSKMLLAVPLLGLLSSVDSPCLRDRLEQDT